MSIHPPRVDRPDTGVNVNVATLSKESSPIISFVTLNVTPVIVDGMFWMLNPSATYEVDWAVGVLEEHP